MTSRKGHTPAGVEANLLKELVNKSDDLYLYRGSVRTRRQFEVPVNEWNIPVREALLEAAMGAIATDHHWTGRQDVHHIAWPFSSYRALSSHDFESVGEVYRSTAAVKVRIPRQLHDFIHLMTPPPPVPTEDVMEQYMIEDIAIRQLYRVTRIDEAELIGKYIDIRREAERYEQYLHALEHLQPAEVGHLPDHEYLTRLELSEAREALGGLTKVLNFSGYLRARSA